MILVKTLEILCSEPSTKFFDFKKNKINTKDFPPMKKKKV